MPFKSPTISSEWNSPPTAVSCKNRIVIFAVDSNGTMFRCFSDDRKRYSDWASLTGIWTSPPAAVSWGENRVDLFALGRDNSMLHTPLTMG